MEVDGVGVDDREPKVISIEVELKREKRRGNWG
jgi:hypothetical protein